MQALTLTVCVCVCVCVCVRVFQKLPFFEIFVLLFYFMYKYHKKFLEKISGHLEVIWPPHWMMANFLPNRPPRGLNRLYSTMVQDIDAIFCQTPAFMLYYMFFTSSMHKPCISGFSISLRFFCQHKRIAIFRGFIFCVKKVRFKTFGLMCRL